MNNARRKRIAEALAHLTDALDIIEECATDERDAFDAMPEGPQASERGQASEAAADALDEAKDAIETARDAIEAIE